MKIKTSIFYCVSREDFASHPDLDSYRAAVNELKLPPIKLDNPKSFVIQDWKERIKLGQEERGEEVHNDNYSIAGDLKVSRV